MQSAEYIKKEISGICGVSLMKWNDIYWTLAGVPPINTVSWVWERYHNYFNKKKLQYTFTVLSNTVNLMLKSIKIHSIFWSWSSFHSSFEMLWFGDIQILLCLHSVNHFNNYYRIVGVWSTPAKEKNSISNQASISTVAALWKYTLQDELKMWTRTTI